MRNVGISIVSSCYLALLALAFGFDVEVRAAVPVKFSRYNPTSEIKITTLGSSLLRVQWNTTDGGRCAVTFDLGRGASLLQSLEVDTDQSGSLSVIAQEIQPRFDVTVGTRKNTSWPYVFFDRVNRRPYQKHTADLDPQLVQVVSDGLTRAKIIISKIAAGPFWGDLVFYVYSGSPFIQIEAAMETYDPRVAYLYDVLFGGSFSDVVYKDNVTDDFVHINPSSPLAAKKVRNRTIMAQFPFGTLAVFPAPHAYIYPTDLTLNLGFVQVGEENGRDLLGTKSHPEGDGRFMPWIDAPCGRTQHMGVFLLLSTTQAVSTLDCVKSYTHGDAYKKIPGYITMAEHFHEAMAMTDDTARPSGPAFREAMMDLNVDAVHLAEFHGDGNPRDTGKLRLDQLKKMFDVCKKYSIPGAFLLMPGEEANAWFGGHNMYFFPKPVYITLKREAGQPYKEHIDGYGDVYHVQNATEYHRALKENKGIAWTSHPRIKGSLREPDSFVNQPYFQDDSVWLGGDWKAMPLDLSEDRLGMRALRLLDDMSQLGYDRQIIGEVDPFKLDKTHEVYAHMNINYLKVVALPSATDWSPVLNAIKNKEYFTTTGEVLIHSWEVASAKDKVLADIEWTFPMSFAEVIWGEGDDVKRMTVPLTDTKELVSTVQHFEWPVNLTNAKWVRIEAWDIARNGAFTPTLWLKTPSGMNPIVYGFTLINAENNCPIPEYDPIPEGATLNLSSLPTKNLNIRANSNLMATVIVKFGYDGNEDYCVDRDYPYELFSSSAHTLTVGKHAVTATPSVDGVVGASRTLNFTIIDMALAK